MNGRPFLLLLPVALVVVLVGLTLVAPREEATALFRPDNTALEECPPDSVRCISQALGNLTWQEGPAPAMAVVRDAFGTGTLIERACHSLTHKIGAAAYLRAGGSAKEAFSIGDNLCNSGYFHGVAQAAFAGIDGSDAAALVERAFEVCDDPSISGSPDAYQLASRCAHGVGHGAMLAANGRLAAVLQVCDGLLAFPGRADPNAARPTYDFGGFASTCANGAFMEAFSPTDGQVYDEWAREGDPLHPCTIMPDRYARECYTTLVARLGPLAGSLEGVPALCLLAPGPRAGDCLVGYATEFSSSIVGVADPGRALIAGCLRALPWLSQCIHATVDALGHHYETAREVAPYCGALPDGWLSALCARTIGWTIGNERRDPAECADLGPALASACALGTRDEVLPGGPVPDPLDADYPPDPAGSPWLAALGAP